jgi:hypothetical protein
MLFCPKENFDSLGLMIDEHQVLAPEHKRFAACDRLGPTQVQMETTGDRSILSGQLELVVVSDRFNDSGPALDSSGVISTVD